MTQFNIEAEGAASQTEQKIDEIDTAVYRRVLNNMLQRCTNPNNDHYKNYGGRGITICDRWLGKGKLERFLEDMGPKPTPTHTLDRINNDGGYYPENCRWATRTQQVRNRRLQSSNTSGVEHITIRNNKWYVQKYSNGVKRVVGTYASLNEAVRALIDFEVTEARLDQIMRDFLKHSLCTEVDESILIEIRKSQEEQVHEELRKEIK